MTLSIALCLQLLLKKDLIYVLPLPHDVVPHVDDPPHEVVPPVDEVTLHWSRKLRNHILDTRLSR